MVVAIYGFIFFPDTPYDTKAFYLNAEEKARCLERIVEDGRQETVNSFSWGMFLRAARSWQLYVLAVLFMWVSPSPDACKLFGGGLELNLIFFSLTR